jgi:Na+-translocating ferredoxin:NAD+ oxidoreductase RnfD subunit
MLMMVTTHYTIYLTLLFFALFQKQFLHYNARHFFNPSNFALILGLLLFYNDAHIVLGQLGHEVWLIWAVSIVALAILYRVDRWVLSFSFVLFYLFFQYIMIVNSDPVIIMENIYHRFYSVSFVIFILFMLTDPKTTPTKLWHQVSFAMTIAFLTTFLDYMYGFRVQHLFLVLFFCSPWVVFLEEYSHTLDKKALIVVSFTVIILALSAIIYIQMQPPYYFEMDGQ